MDVELTGKKWNAEQRAAALQWYAERHETYRKRDGSAVTAFQVHGRTKNYPQLFEREGSRVRRLRE